LIMKSGVRYIVRGLIDGSLSTLGIVLGASIGGDPKVIMAAGLGGGIANSISNLLGALTGEKAGVMIKLAKYEKAMVGCDVNLKDTKVYEKEKKRIWKAGIFDAIATFFGSVLPVMPFLFVPFGLINLPAAILSSIVLTVSLLFALGIYLGKLSKENILWAGTKMAIFGIITAVLAMSLEFLL
jgi:predicted membrane protein (TIGR00267 family)